MPIWTVHVPPSPGISVDPAEDAVLIREGFSWGALIFAPIWALAHRLWLAFAIWLVAMIVISLIGAKLGNATGWTLTIAFLLWFAWEARDFQRAKLNRREWQLVDIVEARTTKAAERRYYEKLAADLAIGGRTQVTAPLTVPPPPPFGVVPTIIGYTS
jgi:hypothetical protein